MNKVSVYIVYRSASKIPLQHIHHYNSGNRKIVLKPSETALLELLSADDNPSVCRLTKGVSAGFGTGNDTPGPSGSGSVEEDLTNRDVAENISSDSDESMCHINNSWIVNSLP